MLEEHLGSVLKVLAGSGAGLFKSRDVGGVGCWLEEPGNTARGVRLEMRAHRLLCEGTQFGHISYVPQVVHPSR